MTKSIINIDIKSHQGGRMQNQDYATKLSTKLGQLVVLCDGAGGMGGANAGRMASQLTVKVIKGEFSKLKGAEDPKTELGRIIHLANSIVYKKGLTANEYRGMGTTIVVTLFALDNKVYTGHVGDSRLYQIRNGKKIFRTRDHSEAQRMIDAGKLSYKKARFYTRGNIIDRAIGAKERVEVEINETSYKKGDIFLLSSDGVHDEMEEKDLLAILNKNEGVEHIANELIKLANKSGAERKKGRHDNMTAIVIRIGDAVRVGIGELLRKKALPVLLILIVAFTTALYWDTIKGFVMESPKPPLSTTFTISEEHKKEIDALCEQMKKETNEKRKEIIRQSLTATKDNLGQYCKSNTDTTRCDCIPETFPYAPTKDVSSVLKVIKENLDSQKK